MSHLNQNAKAGFGQTYQMHVIALLGLKMHLISKILAHVIGERH
jgi:hypothetical protein